MLFWPFAGSWRSQLSSARRAQLNECALIDALGLINAPGGCIAKPLASKSVRGKEVYDAVFLEVHHQARSGSPIKRGRQLFQRKFSLDEGLGPRLNAISAGTSRRRALGAGLSDSCASCHGRPRGSAGAGGDVATFPDSRDAPHLFGLGLIEMLSDEVTADLRAIREKALSDARGGDAASGAASPDGEPGPFTARLLSKGIDFGRITAFSDGRVDTSAVRGVDADLRVRPFLHQGITASIREFIVGALNAEMGLQAWDPIICAATDPVKPQAMTSPSGFKYDPALDKFERPPSCSNAEDPDGDGHAGEIDPALVDYLEFYLLNYFKPGQYRTTPRAAEGLQFMERDRLHHLPR